MPEQVGANGPPVGRVVGTEDSTPLQFRVALDEDAYLQLDDVVVTVRAVPGLGPVTTAGVVTEVRARHEGATLRLRRVPDRDGVLPAQVQEIAEVTTTRVEPECYVPPRPGALGLPRHRRRAGEGAVLRPDGAQGRRSGSAATATPIYVNLEFLDGTRGGARVDQRDLRGRDQDQLRAVPAALALHRRRARQPRGQRQGAGVLGQGRGPAVPRPRQPQARRWTTPTCGPPTPTLGLPAEPFASVGFFAPPTPDDLTGRPHVTGRTSGRQRVLVDAAPSSARRAAAVRLRRRRGRAQPVHDGRPPGRGAAAPGGASPAGTTARSPSTAGCCAPTTSWSTSSSTGSPTTTPARDWAGPVTGAGTINAFIRRLRSCLKPLRAHRPRRPARRRAAGW